MLNLWPYEYCGMIKIIDIKGNVFVGEAQEITDANERFEEEMQEDRTAIIYDGMLVEFYQREIAIIEKL